MLILLLFPLTFLIILTLLSSLFTDSSNVVALFNEIDTNSIINGSTTTLELTNTANSFNFDPLLVAITWIVVLTILAGVIGFNVVGSGLNASSSKIIVVGTAWSTAFIFFGITAYPLIIIIPLSWGELMYVSLTVMYAIGVFKQIGDS